MLKTQKNPKSVSQKHQPNCFLDCFDRKYFHSTKMSQGGNENRQALETDTETIGEKFSACSQKSKSLYSFARIYKVPEDLRKLNESAYIPRLIAIGPLHQKDEHLPKAMQDLKMDYANHLFLRLAKGISDSRIRDETKDKAIQECVEDMKKCKVKAKKYYQEEEFTMVDKARKYYGEELNLKDEDMLEMMLVDGCFILELLYVSYHTNCYKGDSKSNSTSCEQPRADPIFDNILTANIVTHDLMLLENQIPFFVLEHLFQLTVDQVHKNQGCPEKLSLEGYVSSFFRKFSSLEGAHKNITGNEPKTSCCLPSDHCILSICGSTKENRQEKKESGKLAIDYYHILHFIHSSYVPGEEGKENEPGLIKQNSTRHTELTLCASDLHYAGVKFVPTTDLLEVEFINRGIFCWRFRTLAFRIPTIYIRKTTEAFLRNVIALEQCSPGVPRYFTSYAKLMDMFINSEQDVRVLINDKVIHNYLSTDEDVRDLFNKLCKEVVLEDFHFNKECGEASEFNMHWQTRAVRYVRRLFIASPWPALAFFLGIVTFTVTVYQFGYSIHKRIHR